MNGQWMAYGKQPAQFIASWRQIHTLFAQHAPHVAMVWSPSQNDATNQFPYDIYWPGPEYVDWVGLSVYWKGLGKKE